MDAQFSGGAPAKLFARAQRHDGFAGKGIVSGTVHSLRCRVTVPVFSGRP